MKRKWLILTAGIILLFNSARAEQTQKEELYDQVKIFSEVLSKIREDYVEEVEVKKLIYGAIKGMVGTLDPFSQFMEKDINKVLKEDTKGEFGGLGIRIAIRDKRLTVVTPLPGTPAYRLGILPGDKIVKIEGESTEGITLLEAVKKLRGEKGTKVTITIQREGEKDLLDFTITRDIIKIQSVSGRMLTETIGYIRLAEFSQKTPADMDKKWKELEEQGMENLILDLRNNPGGLLPSAVAVTKRFIGDNKIVVSTRGRYPEQEIKYFADRQSRQRLLPLVVLVNHGSASGSEIVAGAIQDWSRGVILGETTFGKGSVQSMITLEDGSGLRLTTAKYYTPNGRTIHEKGITPDIEVKVSKEMLAKLMMQREEEEIKIITKGLKSRIKKEEKEKEEEERVTDIQLERAKDILLAREIWEGRK